MRRIIVFLFLSVTVFVNAQRGCGYDQRLQEKFYQDPAFEIHHNQIMNSLHSGAQLSTQSTTGTLTPTIVVTIPVVFHVLYKDASQNISDDQINSQLEVLNDDYRKLNADFSTVVPAVFQPLGADLEITFVKATTNPQGNPTTGITRKAVSPGFDFYNNYYTISGTPAWDTLNYLNIWVGKFDSGQLLGFASPPSEAGTSHDGICISYDAFGTEGTADSPFDKGRTTTHEIGHYFGLEHLWGNGNGGCGQNGSDNVADTPSTSGPYSGCPSFPNNSFACNNTTNGSMFMNFMDYVDDACMAFFTTGQKAVTQVALANERASLVLGNTEYKLNTRIKLYPNPSSHSVTVESAGVAIDKVEVFDQGGRQVKSAPLNASNTSFKIDNLANGVYFFRMYSGKNFIKSDKLIKI